MKIARLLETILLAACLAEAHPVEVRGSEVVVAFAEHDTFNRKMADGREHRAAVDGALRDLAGSSLRVVFELRELEHEPDVQPPSEDDLVARHRARPMISFMSASLSWP